MKNLNIKTIENNFAKNFNKITTNNLITIKYIYITKYAIKNCYFNGLCLGTNKNKTIYITNKLKKENILMKFNLKSPIIYNFKLIKNIRKKYRINKLYFIYN
jgi:hypothetical protein